MKWTDESIATLKRLIDEKKSSGQIALLMNFTREKVCGKAWRLGLPLGGAGLRAKKKKPRPPAPPKPEPKRRGLHLVSDGTLEALAAMPDIARVKSIVDLEINHCRYPVGEPLAGFCGSTRREGTPYCEQHLARCYRAAPVVRERPTLVLVADAGVRVGELEDA